VLKQSIREDDLICRYGGEEFLFFLAGVNSLQEACILTDRIRKNVEDTYFDHEELQPRNNLTMSFGVTLLPKKDEFFASLNRYELKKIANEADMALAEAKERFAGLQAQVRRRRTGPKTRSAPTRESPWRGKNQKRSSSLTGPNSSKRKGSSPGSMYPPSFSTRRTDTSG
jgi:GGDEF domain-containing protein